MLRRLHIRDFAVVESLDLELGEGLSVFTGETGAGKSILIEALGFLMGERGSTDWLRSGAKKLEVSGEFGSEDLPKTLRQRFGIREDAFRLRRELDAGGRSRASLEGRPIKLSELSELGAGLVDFHGQHEHQTLLKPAIQLELLDDYGDLGDLCERTASAYLRHKELKARLESLAMSEEERLRRVDLYRFQVDEIREVDPKPGEEGELEAELPRLKNAEKLLTLAGEAYSRLYEAEGSAEESLRGAEKALEDMRRLDPSLSAALDSLARARETVEETASVLARYREDVGVSPERLDELIGRQDRIARLKRKYGASIEEVLAYRDRIRAELEALENHAEKTQEVERDLARAEKSFRKAADELHKARMKTAKRMSSRVMTELKDLGLAGARLSVSVEMEEDYLGPAGSDRVEFLIAPNPGEPLKPLRSIASGGELSRVMLALKTVLARQDKVALLVFDEVDAGVGAAVGSSVGGKLAELGRSRQVLAVTHLPQVACSAGSHYQVSKKVSGGRTFARTERLEGRAREEALARMLGGRKVTDVSLKHARELMGSA